MSKCYYCDKETKKNMLEKVKKIVGEKA